MKKITILLVDDHRLLRESLCSILNSDGRFHVIGDTGEGTAAIKLFKTLKPDIVLLDLNMSPVDGFDIGRQICGDDHLARVIGLGENCAVGFVKRLLSLGAMGYLTKNSSKEEMKKAIIEVNNGNKYICEEVKNAILRIGIGIARQKTVLAAKAFIPKRNRNR